MRFFLVLALSALCCCRAASIVPQNQDSLRAKVKAAIGDDAAITQNSSATFALAQTPNNPTAFVVIRLADLQIVVTEKISQGSVTWSGEMQIKVVQIPGIVKMDSKPGDIVRLIDLNKYVIQKK
jgi:hypothetical protein